MEFNMKKIAILFGAVSSLVFGDTQGYFVYKTKCASCHVETISKAEFVKNISKMKAPPMLEVANQLKSHILVKDGDEDIHRQLVVLFIKNYIDNPNLDYSLCNPGAIERFGVMPSQKNKIGEEEKQAVAEWIYDRYDGVEFK
jgi:hypothetical protein